MKIQKVDKTTTAVQVANPFAEIASALMDTHGEEILVNSEGAFPPYSEEALAEKIQQEWGKQPGVVKVRIADRSRSPERYRISIEY